MLLIHYVFATTIFVLLTLSYDFGMSFVYIYEAVKYPGILRLHELKNAILTIIVYLFSGLITVLMFRFTKFHRKIVSENKTTIEDLEKKSAPYKSKYDIDFWFNWEQVMGKNVYLWWIPIMPHSCMPPGDGIYYKKNKAVKDSDDDSDDSDDDDENPGSVNNTGQNMNNSSSQQFAGNNNQPGLDGAPRDLRAAGQANEGDRMTIHNDNQNRWDNLNNIVRADNNGQVYRSNASDENSMPTGSRAAAVGHANTVGARQYEEDRVGYYANNLNPAAQPARGTHVHDASKSSTGQLMRRTREASAPGGAKRSSKASPGIRPKGKGRATGAGKPSAAARYRSGLNNHR